MINIFDYTSYRSFIKDYYTDQKKRNSRFSYQYFADRAGFSTKTFIPKVINGEKKLAQRSMFLLIKAMKLNKKESQYFELMMEFNNAKDFKEKEYYFNKLRKSNKKLGESLKLENIFYCFGEWYYKVLYELVSIFDWKDNFKVLAKLVSPPITSKRAETAVRRMEELGLIKKETSGRYVRTSNIIFMDDTLFKLTRWRFSEQIMKKGVEAFNKGYEEQQFYTITESISSETLKKVKQEIDTFYDRIIKIINEKKDQEEKVVQLNVQLFPLTKSLKM